jgi:cation:H+ antiporter
MTQLTLVFGLLPFLGPTIFLGEQGSPRARGQQATAWLTALAMVALALLLADDHIGHLDAGLLILAWLAGSRLVYRDTRIQPQLPLDEKVRGRLRFVARLLVALVVIAVGATLAVEGLIQLADTWGVPAFAVAFFGASIGTSLPELVVAVTALRRGQASLAIGDVLGSSFADATLSIAVGPLFFPTVIDGELAVKGALVAAGAAVVAALLLGRGGEHDRRSGAILLVIYVASWPIVL